MTLKTAIVMDPIENINIAKDTSFAILLEVQQRGWPLYYLEQKDLYAENGVSYGNARPLSVKDDPENWYELGDSEALRLQDFDVILMRKDPPFDMEYIYTTYLLEQAEKHGTLVVNKPQSLRDTNEKLATLWFPQCCVPHLVSRNMAQIKTFLHKQHDVIIKPLDGMGGASIFRIQKNDPNSTVIIETLTQQGQRFAMVQRYIPAVSQGDKRILLINGDPIPYALARIPAPGETRGNLAAGGKGVGVRLSERDLWICAELRDTLRAKGLLFVGIDVIGDFLTEINVTSPTCARELDKLYSLNISAKLLDCIERFKLI